MFREVSENVLKLINGLSSTLLTTTQYYTVHTYNSFEIQESSSTILHLWTLACKIFLLFAGISLSSCVLLNSVGIVRVWCDQHGANQLSIDTHWYWPLISSSITYQNTHHHQEHQDHPHHCLHPSSSASLYLMLILSIVEMGDQIGYQWCTVRVGLMPTKKVEDKNQIWSKYHSFYNTNITLDLFEHHQHVKVLYFLFLWMM